MIPTALLDLFHKLLGPVLVIAGLCLAVYAGAAHIYHLGDTAGAARVQQAWDKEKLAAQKAVATRAEQQTTATHAVETVYVDRWNTITEKGKTIIKEVPTYVPASTPPLPGGWRVLHDAAATGTDPDTVSKAAGGAAAAPVPAQDAIATVVDNYTGCRRNAAAVEAWQAWAEKQEALNAMQAP